MPQSLQYDDIGTNWENVHQINIFQAERLSVDKILGSVSGLRILDLACGAGRWTRQFADMGAAHVVGVDISSAMIEAAKNDNKGYSNVEYYVGDLSKPLVDDKNKPLFTEKFDVVFAAWMLPYAPDATEMENMWRTIAGAMKPGGRFLTVGANYDLDWTKPNPFPPEFGFEVTPVQTVNQGQWDEATKVRLRARVKTPFEFEVYIMKDKRVIENTAKNLGLTNVSWHWPECSKGSENRDFWDNFAVRPNCNLFYASMPA